MALRTSNLPQTVVWLCPARFEKIQQHLLDLPRIVVRFDGVLSTDMESAGNCAVDVELVTGASRLRASAVLRCECQSRARQVSEFEFVDVAVSLAVHFG